MNNFILFFALSISCGLAQADSNVRKPCEELRAEIAAKIDANNVPSYTLDIVDNDKVGPATVVGSCDGGTKKITYTRH